MPRRVRRFNPLFFLVLITLVLVAAPAFSVETVTVEFFFEPGCSECAQVKEEILPELEALYGGFYELVSRDIGEEGNYLKLARYQDSLEAAGNEPVSMVLEGTLMLNGLSAIREGLFPAMDQILAEGLSVPGEISAAVEPAPAGDDDEVLSRRVRGFTLAGVLVAGLVDGINPCAIATLVFFISLLSVLKVSGRDLVIVGITFCVATFVTYTAIGFGLLRALHLFSGFAMLQTVINVGMTLFLLVLAFLSFRDAYRFHRTGRAGDVTLQVPHSIKMKIHKVMKKGMATGHLVMGSLFIGAAVTALESVCTGQVYLPTLVMVIKSGQADLFSVVYLLIYNLAFMVPIVTVFILVLQGMRTATLLDWSRKNVVSSKVLLGVFFLGMAGLLLIL
jgi:hypothetical protein